MFKVPRRCLAGQSTLFSSMYLAPACADQPAGQSIDCPIVIAGIKAHDFKQLLRALFLRCAICMYMAPNSSHLYRIRCSTDWAEQNQAAFSIDDWLAVLRLSTDWKFDEIRRLAIRSLHTDLASDPARMVFVARQYNINDWLIPALNALAQRTTSPTYTDYELLGPEWILKLVQVREAYVTPCAMSTLPKRMSNISLPYNY